MIDRIWLTCFMTAGLIACGDDPPTSEDTPSAACRARASTEFRTRVVGTGLAELDGRGVTAVSTISTLDGVECRASALALVDAGGFIARTMNLRDDAVYPRIAVYIDLDNDGACTADADLVFVRYTSAPPPGTEDMIQVGADAFATLPDAEGCALVR